MLQAPARMKALILQTEQTSSNKEKKATQTAASTTTQVLNKDTNAATATQTRYRRDLLEASAVENTAAENEIQVTSNDQRGDVTPAIRLMVKPLIRLNSTLLFVM